MSDLTEFELYAVGRIKGLQKELAELKASIPKIKHDAIMEVTERYETRASEILDKYSSVVRVSDLRSYATQLTQAEGTENAKG